MENFGIGEQKKPEDAASIDSDSGVMQKNSISFYRLHSFTFLQIKATGNQNSEN
jgi:hypothetical protein